MNNISLLCFLTVLSVTLERRNSSAIEKCFTAAVYEHVRFGDNVTIELSNVSDVISNNLNIYEVVAKEAASRGAQILVFPEDGIFQISQHKNITAKHLEEIPDDTSVNPCLDSSFVNRPILTSLSCMAKRNNMFLVGHMAERKNCRNEMECNSLGFKQFNTAVVFDNNGFLIAKYHKYHLYNVKSDDFPKEQEFITFETPFGKFGILICFDLIFKEPGIHLAERYNVNTIVFPTWWYDELPFLTAHQYQQSWAIRNKVNFLASGVNKIDVGSTGSGIYSGVKGAVIYQHNLRNQSANLLIARINVNASDDYVCPPYKINVPMNPLKLQSNHCSSFHCESDGKKNKDLVLKQLNITIYNHTKLSKRSDEMKLCQNGFCCSLRYQVTYGPLNNYYFIVGSRLRKHDLGPVWCEEMCGLVLYDEKTGNYLVTTGIRFDNLRIEAHLKTIETYAYPSLVTNDLKLIPKEKWSYFNNATVSIIESKNNDQPIVIAGLYGRCYDKDPPFLST